MRTGEKWTKEETMVAMYLYCLIPFKKAAKDNKKVIYYANLLGRTPSAMAMKLGNLGSLDSSLREKGISGLKNHGKMEEIIWKDFLEDKEAFIFEAEEIIAGLEGNTLEEKYPEIETRPSYLGEERERLVKTRINQNFFRKAVLTAYNGKCAITGLPIEELLIASHIIPWAANAQERLNPRNGICLNSLHDAAFDKGFITIDKNYEIINSTKIKEFYDNAYVKDVFEAYEHKQIFIPKKFGPSLEAIEYHNDVIFLG